MDGADRETALGGVLVADFSRVLAGPLATMLLGDLGADVVKVERPGTGDDTRAWGPPYLDGESAYYLAVNRNKRSAVVDVLTGLFAANAILAALLARSATGRGQRVEVDLMSCLLAGLVNQASSFVTTGELPRAIGNRHPAISPYEMFGAADRPLVVAVGNDRQFAGLAGALEMDWLASDERF